MRSRKKVREELDVYEELEFDFLEVKLMEWDDETSRRWAFDEFVHGALVSGDYHNFIPQSMGDYRYIDIAGRRRAMEVCLNMVRSERFSEERMMSLRELKDFLKTVEPQDFRRFREIFKICGLSGGKYQEYSLNYLDTREGGSSEKESTDQIEDIRQAVIKEIRMRVGYLNLVYQLLRLGADGDPDELIPKQAFYRTWPPAGTIVVAWDVDTDEKVVGRMAEDKAIDFYETAVDPVDGEAHALGLDLPLAQKRVWAYRALPLELVEFYREHPGLFAKHRQVLDIEELDYVAELLQA